MKTKLHYRILVFILLLFLPKISYSQCAPTEVNLGNDTTLCQGETLSFDLSNLPNNPTVTWEDGSTSLTRTISTARVYAVETNDYHAGWDGTYMNKLVEEGTYVWIIRFEELYTTDVVQLTGVVSVLQ